MSILSSIIAKFRVHQVSKIGDTEAVHAHAVYDGSEENKAFSKLTPNANLSIHIDNPDAQNFLVPDQEYFVTFSPANPEAHAAAVAKIAAAQVPLAQPATVESFSPPTDDPPTVVPEPTSGPAQ